nr:prolyl oligopeptidase family serine peptidase [Oceanococcus sp. HetDA_MAG_MS8]
MRELRAIGLALVGVLAVQACGGGRPDKLGAAEVLRADNHPAGEPLAGIKTELIRIDSSAVQQALTPVPAAEDPRLPEAILSYLPGSEPTRLVVMCHGLNQDVRRVWVQHTEAVARSDTAALATNYRDNFRFPIAKGAHDVIAATLQVKARFPSIETVYLMGVSMGGAVAATAITESIALSADGQSLFQHWIAPEPLTNLVEAWAEASVALPAIAADIEHDAGGTPLQVPAEYVRRSGALNADMMAAGDLKTLTMTHAVNDGLVVYNQAREMATAAAAFGIPTQLWTVLRVAPEQDTGSQLTAAITGFIGAPDPTQPLGLSGHGWEGDPHHPIMRIAFEQLEMLLDGSYDESLPYAEYLVDEGEPGL